MKKNIFYIILTMVILVTSCELPDNIDPKNPSKVAPGSEFIQAHISLVNQIGSINVNQNISRLLAQYQSEVTYLTESRYNFSDRQIPDNYSGAVYRNVLMNLKDCRLKLEATEAGGELANQKTNQLAILEILSVYSYQLLVDHFGDVPYSESLLGAENSRPKYDDALTIYKDLVNRINKAISDIKVGSSGFGDDDILYGDDMSLWKKFAASIKLRIGMRLADVPDANPGTIVSAAVAAGVFSSQDESAIQPYTGVAPYVNSYYNEFILGARKDFCPTNTLVDLMNTLNDPRRAIWFTPYPDPGVYTGLTYGKLAASSYSKFSHFSDLIRATPTYPVILLDYVEVEFMLAEAAERGFAGTPADAEAHYNNAILASMSYWGVSDADAQAYLAQPEVAYTTAAGTYKQKIGTQKWLGLFDQGDEGWTEWRRLDYPILNPPEAMTYSDIPVRMPYPYNENKMNKDNYVAASAAIGGDEASTKLFWDKY